MNPSFDPSAVIKSLRLHEPTDFSAIACFAIDSAIGGDNFVDISCNKYVDQMEFIEAYPPDRRLEIASILLQSLQGYYVGSQTAQLSIITG